MSVDLFGDRRDLAPVERTVAPAAALRMVTFEVFGAPAPKGSMRAMIVGGKARIVASSNSGHEKRLALWVASVRVAARRAIGAVLDDVPPPFIDVPLYVEIEFRLERPAGHYGTGRNADSLKPSAPRFPHTKPDGDKLLRTTWDALTGVVFDDDSRIVEFPTRKRYAARGREGATITIREAM